MRLACPNCDATYEVPDDAIPPGGRDVQCSNCGNAWFQLPPDVSASFKDSKTARPAPAAAAASPSVQPSRPAASAFPEADEDVTEVAADTGLAPKAAAPDHDVLEAVAVAMAGPAPVAEPVPVSRAPEPVADEDPAVAVARLLADEQREPVTAAPKVQLAPDVRDILREEAAIEAGARRHEAQRNAARRADAETQFQTQPDLGVEDLSPPPAATSAVQRRLAMLRGENPDRPAAEPARPPARRDLLPDVEEINSTLKPGDDNYDADAAVDALPDLTRSSGFRNGFLLAFVVLIIATGVYVMADPIAELVPAIKEPLTRYVTTIDALRLWLNALMDNATQALSR